MSDHAKQEMLPDKILDAPEPSGPPEPVQPGGKRADGLDNKWVYDWNAKMWVAPDGQLVDAPAPAKKRGGKKGNKGGKGQKLLYKPRFIKIAADACSRGCTDAQVADLLDIGMRTLYKWRTRYPLFGAAFKNGKKEAHIQVERSLYHRAVGYDYEEEKFIQGHRVVVRQHMPPDTAAAIFYLKNKRPEKWRDIQRYESGRPGEFDQINDPDELRRLLTEKAIELGLLAPADPKLIEANAVETPRKEERAVIAKPPTEEK